MTLEYEQMAKNVNANQQLNTNESEFKKALYITLGLNAANSNPKGIFIAKNFNIFALGSFLTGIMLGHLTAPYRKRYEQDHQEKDIKIPDSPHIKNDKLSSDKFVSMIKNSREDKGGKSK